MMARALTWLVAFLACAVPVPVVAQCRLCGAPTTTRPSDEATGEVRLEVETSLNFDRLIQAGAGDGVAILRPDGSSSSTGSVTDMSPRAMVATVTVHGEAGRMLRVELPRQIVLHSLSGGQITFDDVTSDLPSMPRLDPTGTLTFRFGGRLRISGDADGEYRGDLPITAEYL